MREVTAMKRRVVIGLAALALAAVLVAATLVVTPSTAQDAEDNGFTGNFGGTSTTVTAEACTYEVHPEGTGTITLTIESEEGKSEEETLAFVIVDNKNEFRFITLGQRVFSGVAKRQVVSDQVTQEITLDELPALVPTAGEVSEILGMEMTQRSEPGLGQEYEHVDLETLGLLAGHQEFYRQLGEELEVAGYTSVALFKTTEGASGAFKHVFEEWERDLEVFKLVGERFEVEDIIKAGADEAHGIIFAKSSDNPFVTTVMVLRVDNVVGSLFVLRDEATDQEVGELARKVIEKIKDKSIEGSWGFSAEGMSFPQDDQEPIHSAAVGLFSFSGEGACSYSFTGNFEGE
jgi:hypothetical protein